MSLSPWLMKACLIVGMRSTCEVLPEFAGCSITLQRRVLQAHQVGDLRDAEDGDVRRLDLLHHEALAEHDDRAAVELASVESHMFAWYAEVVPPEKYMPTVGLYVGQPAVEPGQRLLLAGGPLCRAAARYARWTAPATATAQHSRGRRSAPAGVPRQPQ